MNGRSFGRKYTTYYIYLFETRTICLPQLVLTLFAVLAGYNGTFTFEKPTQSYEGHDELLYVRLVSKEI